MNATQYIHAKLQVRIRAISILQHEYAITTLCRVLGVSKSTYYHYQNTKKASSKRELENQKISLRIQEIHAATDKRLGAHKMKYELEEYGIFISVGRVYRLMNKLNLPQMSTKKAPKPKKGIIEDENLPNILDRCFDAERPNQKWVSDITYIWAENRWYYLCVIMDLFARKIIAYKISAKIDGKLVRDTIKEAYQKRGCPSGVIFHMDRGSQYTAKETRRLFDEYNMVASYSKKGCPFDNAVVEANF